MKTNEELQKDVEDAIKWEPLLNAAEIGVTAKDGVVVISGAVDSYGKKVEAEAAAKSVAGVTAVVEKIEIVFDDSYDFSDTDIAKEALTALRLNCILPNDKVMVKVENGGITLYGDLNWEYEQEAAINAVTHLKGVKGVKSDIKVKSETHNQIEKKLVEAAFARNWSISRLNIKAEASGTKIKLTGKVDSLYQKEEAGRIAWNTPGVWTVDNELVVNLN